MLNTSICYDSEIKIYIPYSLKGETSSLFNDLKKKMDITYLIKMINFIMIYVLHILAIQEQMYLYQQDKNIFIQNMEIYVKIIVNF